MSYAYECEHCGYAELSGGFLYVRGPATCSTCGRPVRIVRQWYDYILWWPTIVGLGLAATGLLAWAVMRS